MSQLEERLDQIIKAITREYIETGEPVGSKVLTSKYKMEVSPATIRNEMVKLAEQGFLDKPHFSAGRIPTSTAFKYYIQNHLTEEELSVADEVEIKQKLWEERGNTERLIRRAVTQLSKETENLTLAIVDNCLRCHNGSAYILDHPEFYDINLTRSVLHLLDEEDLINTIFQKIPENIDQGILLGRDLGLESLEPCGLVFTRIYPEKNQQGFLALLGPMRLHYGRIIPRIRYFQNLINQLGSN